MLMVLAEAGSTGDESRQRVGGNTRAEMGQTLASHVAPAGVETLHPVAGKRGRAPNGDQPDAIAPPERRLCPGWSDTESQLPGTAASGRRLQES